MFQNCQIPNTISYTFLICCFPYSGTNPEFQARGSKIREKNSNTHLYVIKKLSIKTNTQKSLFLNILRSNHLSTKTKDTKHYYFLIYKTLLFFLHFFFKINMGWVDDSYTHLYVIRKLSIKTNTQKSLILNILRCNYLSTKTKDTRHYYFLIYRTHLFFLHFFFLKINMSWVDDS